MDDDDQVRLERIPAAAERELKRICAAVEREKGRAFLDAVRLVVTVKQLHGFVESAPEQVKDVHARLCMQVIMDYMKVARLGEEQAQAIMDNADALLVRLGAIADPDQDGASRLQ